MKKIIPFTNDIKFDTKIYDITSISLEHNLKLNNNNLIKGEFIISGDYKMTSSSTNEEPFIKTLPFDIALDDKYDSSSIEIDIDDFNYEILNEEELKVDIKVSLDGIQLIDEEEILPDVVINKEERNEEEIIDLFKEDNEEITPVFKNEILNTFTDEEYVTYYVHIVRENDNVDSMCKKYNVEKEDIEKYNELENITLGSKIIIPYVNESI